MKAIFWSFTYRWVAVMVVLVNLPALALEDVQEVAYTDVPGVATSFLAKELCSCVYVTKRPVSACYQFAKQTVTVWGYKLELSHFKVINDFDPATKKGDLARGYTPSMGHHTRQKWTIDRNHKCAG